MFGNIKIIEFASVLAGPLAGSFFAELGAEVIKVENKNTGGDVTRGWLLPTENRENPQSAYYCAANFGKKVVYFDLKDRADHTSVMELIRLADVVIINFKAGDAEKLGLDYDSLGAVNPQIIYASLTGFGGQDSRPAFDVVLQAETGFMSMNGEPGRPPIKMPVALIDILAAHHLKEAILCALIQRMQSGKGKYIEISLYESALASLANQATNWLMAKHIAQPMGTKHPNIAPYGDMFLTADDKYLVFAIGTDRQFKNLCDLLGISMGGFETNAQRVQKRDTLNQILSPIIQAKASTHWSSLFRKHQIPYGLVKNMQEVLEDPKAQASLLVEMVADQKTVRMRTALV